MLDLITQYEHGDLGPDDTVELFAERFSGMSLAADRSAGYGSAQRTAQNLVDMGYIDPDGNVIIFPEG